MKNFFLRTFPYPWHLSLIGTWVFVTALYFFTGLLFATGTPQPPVRLPSAPLASALFAALGLLCPINASTAFAAYGGFLLLWFKPPDPIFYVWSTIPYLTLILILGADWFMHKIGIPRTYVKILFNLVFLLVLTLLVNFALWRAWIPGPILL